MIKRDDTVVQVIDTKWKRIAARVDDPKQGVSQSDVYQMMAYGRLYRCGKLTLLYPHHGKAGYDEGPIGDYGISSSEDRLELFSIDMAHGENMGTRLAKVCASISPRVPV